MHCDVHWYHAKFEIKIQPVYRLREREREILHYEVKWTKLHSLEDKLNQIIIKVFRLWLYTRREYKLNIFLNINCNCIILVIGVSSYDGTVLHLLFTVFSFFQLLTLTMISHHSGSFSSSNLHLTFSSIYESDPCWSSRMHNAWLKRLWALFELEFLELSWKISVVFFLLKSK